MDEGSALQPLEPVPSQVAAADGEASGSEEQAEQPLDADEGSPDNQLPACTAGNASVGLATEQQA